MPEEKNLPDPDEIDLSEINVNDDDSDIESINLSEPPDSDDDEEEDDDDDEEDDDDDEEEDDDDDEEEDDDDDDDDDDEDVNNLDNEGGFASSQESDSDTDSDEEDMQKIDRSNIQDYVLENHPEKIMHNQEEIEALSKVFRNKNGEIEDEFHKTVPFITRFEKAKILGLRARQLNQSPEQALVKVDMGIIDGYKIAMEEYKQKVIPFIIKRPLPNGSCEYWKFEDLEQFE